jgi:hypothetical protein
MLARLFCFTLCAYCISAGYAALSAAQSLEEDLKKQAEALRRSSEAKNPRNAGKSQREAERKVRTLEGETGVGEATEPMDPAKHVVRHYRGEEGVPLPARDKIPTPVAPEAEMRPPPKPAVVRGTPRPIRIPPPVYMKRCITHTTRREDTGLPPQVTTPAYDVLYLPPDLLPLDAAEVYGNQVRIRIVREPADAVVGYQLLNERIPCIPYRTRALDSVVFYDEGNFALKNYDAQPRGAGVYHPWIKEKLGLK